MIVAMPNLTPAQPEIFVLAMVSLILIVDLFLSAKNRFITYALTQLTLLGAAWITVSTHTSVPSYTFSNMFVDDAMSDVLKLMSYIAVSVVLVYSRSYIYLRGMFRGEFFALALFALLGMMVMISANHFLVLYMGLELMSLSLYAMVALNRDSALATEAAMKYFVLGALASGLLLYGMSMLYGATGSLNVNQVATVIQHTSGNHVVLTFGLVFIVAGLAFKLGVVPFHMWIPDVYQGAPTAVTLFIGSAPKIAAFAFVMRLLVEGLHGLVQDWQGMLIIMSLLSMAIGNVIAIAQTNIKRMLAYSTISHMGFLLLGILSGTLDGYSSSMFYVLVYVLMSMGGFGMIMLLSRKGFEAENLDDFKGLNQRSPWYAFVMLLLMFSMAGVPPTVGFYAKLSVLQAALQAGFVWVVVAAVLFSVIGAFYYLRIIKLMYFDAPLDDTPLKPEGDMAMLMSSNGFAVLALGLLPQPLMALCAYAIQRSLL
ncbi:NADH-quinone oxidoreductase subunit N [Sulfurimicrobium lacus]|uniref:NADH-quinone oxidoreductase subunit N n=1 Tax=Sulfurimicrobium lacus TaxID=2715678 RepID=A0A6F8V804_9PROT|nr:NADH-quinone oxidoreductase subunit NuoN [Sulfurimicrobium lacus]BCB25794.1 NADH-quinone oxidoreductase subunit N [Sulfurimicrobium lacus]